MTTPRAKSGQLVLDPELLRASGFVVGQKLELRLLPGGEVAMGAIHKRIHISLTLMAAASIS